MAPELVFGWSFYRQGTSGRALPMNFIADRLARDNRARVTQVWVAQIQRGIAAGVIGRTKPNGLHCDGPSLA